MRDPLHKARPQVWIRGGGCRIGSDEHYPEEAPVRNVAVDGFWIDRTPVTNAEFAEFVAQTAYVTTAERRLSPLDFPAADPSDLVPGSLVFRSPAMRPPAFDPASWWQFEPEASWARPLGRGSDVDGLEGHPVVHVSFEDASAFASWCGCELPSEVEWEYAARGGLDSMPYAWGREFRPGGRRMAKTWEGEFPHRNDASDGYPRTAPVGLYPANGYGLVDMIGNVWEWTTERCAAPSVEGPGCCGGVAAENAGSWRILKGGSHLCAPSYCRRYRPAARSPQTEDTSSCHIGFRCIRRAAPNRNH